MTDKTPEELHADELAEQARLEEENRMRREADLASVPQDEPMPATARLRAFEDAMFGEDAVRLDGQIERGRGSKFSEMTEAQRRHYAALEKLVAAEQRLADAHTALIDAEAAHHDAMAMADKTEAEIDAHE